MIKSTPTILSLAIAALTGVVLAAALLTINAATPSATTQLDREILARREATLQYGLELRREADRKNRELARTTERVLQHFKELQNRQRPGNQSRN